MKYGQHKLMKQLRSTAMTNNEAIDEAIEALDEVANDTYEGSELDDPEIQAWQQKKFDAIEVLRGMKDAI